MPPITHTEPLQSQTPLAWAPGSFYRLRDSRYAARLLSVQQDGLRGEIFPIRKLRWVNQEPALDPSESHQTGEWDLRGDFKGGHPFDLMELIR